jgi:hypothetical protein
MSPRHLLIVTLAIALSLPGLAGAREKLNLDGGRMPLRDDGLVGLEWDCASTLLDLRDRKGEGGALCLRALLMDPWAGRSVLVADLLFDADDPIDPAKLDLTLKLDSGRTERHLRSFVVAAAHEGLDTDGVTLELAAGAALADAPADALAGLDQDGGTKRSRATIAWQFQTWDPSVAIDHIQIKIRGEGMAGAGRWKMDEGLVYRGDWEAEASIVFDELAGFTEECRLHEVRKKDADDASDAIGRGATALPFQLRFDALSKSEDTVWSVRFKDHGFVVAFDEGKLRVKGAETFVRPMPTYKDDEVPNRVEIAYDGTFATVRLGNEVFGPMAGRSKGEAGSTRWEIDLDDGKTRLSDVRVSPCTLKDAARWAPPAEPDPTVVVAGNEHEAAKQAEPGTKARRSRRGRAIVAVLSRDGAPVEARRKPRKKSALEVMTTAVTAVQGAMAVGDAMGQFGDDVSHNMDAMDRGDYESMRSSDTEVNIGPGGVQTSRSEVSVSGVSDGNPTVHSTTTTRSVGAPGMPTGAPASAGGPANPATVATIAFVASAGPVTVRIDGEDLGALEQPGSRWDVQVAPGRWSLQLIVDGDVAATRTLVAGRGATATVQVAPDGAITADPAGVVP